MYLGMCVTPLIGNIIIVLLLTKIVFGGNPCAVIDDEPCANNGTCVLIGTDEFKCDCSSDFVGEFCQFKNLCKKWLCLNGGACQTFEDSAVCHCPQNFMGLHCELPLNPTSKSPLTRHPTEGIPYEFKNEDGEIWIRRSFNSQPNNTLRDSEDAASIEFVVLPDGTHWARRFYQQNPFQSGRGAPAFISGRQSLLVCTSSVNCENGGKCVSGHCDCSNTGFRGIHCTEPLDACIKRNCSGHGFCSNNPWNHTKTTCNCDDGFTGIDCEIVTAPQLHPCEVNLTNGCQNNGTCHPDSSFHFSCICTDDFVGSFCQFPNPCKGVSCGPNENPVVVNDTKCECGCNSSFSGQKCDIVNPCATNGVLCLHDGLCVPLNDGTYYCDCKIGFLEPFCKERDPCLLEGALVCQNGATCSRKGNFDYICRCRIPYVNEHCDDTDLCEIDPGECIDDVHTPVGNCYPCEHNQSCEKRGLDKYSCFCLTGDDSPLCIFEETTPALENAAAVEVPSSSSQVLVDFNFNPIIPTVVIASLAVYITFMIIACCYICTDHGHYPCLIVCVDISKYYVETFYLLTLKTGGQISAGTTANVACRLYGSLGCSQVYVLHDYQLNTTVRDQEANFLISSQTNLGNIEKIRIWHDNTGHSPSWYCSSVTIRELKTGKCWYFFIKKWLVNTDGRTAAVVQAIAATEEQAREYFEKVRTRKHLLRLLKNHHIWLATIFGSRRTGFTMLERLTLAMACLSVLFFFLIVCYGVPNIKSHFFFQWDYFEITFENVLQSIKAFPASTLTGLLLMYLFKILRNNIVPVLLIWKNKTRTGQPAIDMCDEKLGTSEVEIKGAGTQTLNFTSFREGENDKYSEEEADNFQRSDMVVRVRKEQSRGDSIAESEGSADIRIDSSQVFRIPSTDILETKKWISGAINDNESAVHIESDDLVRTVRPYTRFSGRDCVVDLGLVGGLTSLKDDDSSTLIYRTKSSENIEYFIEDDVRKSYVEPDTKSLSSVTTAHNRQNIQKKRLSAKKASMYDEDTKNLSRFETNLVSSEPLNTVLPTRSDDLNLNMAKEPVHAFLKHGNNKFNDGENMPKVKHYESITKLKYRDNATNLNKLYVELCAMYNKSHSRNYVVFWWLVCLTLIIVCCSLTILFGSRYNYIHSLNWCSSLGFSFILSCLIYEPFKVWMISFMVSYFEKSGKRKEEPNHDRLKIYNVNGQTVLPKFYPLNYQQYSQRFIHSPKEGL